MGNKTGMLILHYGEHRIELERLTSKAKTAKLSICVKPNAQVIVRAPAYLNDQEIMPFLYQKARWIFEKQQHFLALNQTTTSALVSGSSVFYLGKRYQLKIIETQKKQILLSEHYLEIHTPNTQTEQISNLLENWYRIKAQALFAQRIVALLPQTRWVTQTPELKIRKMKRQWGNCSLKGIITLNTALIQAPEICIDYVILHELCHFAEHNHSKRFYRLLTQVMPEWKKIKERLDNLSLIL